ncbi:60S ribosomal protein L27 [Microtus ochrogaster]|uniref:60S ribosomal protein L27 n=1 Tax=Microtus ochrogaster TaxID=79684 RepID=A0A8J6GHT5_MICOH|nr:60S ribosomal protein L27 [Microtus ochrogaster]
MLLFLSAECLTPAVQLDKFMKPDKEVLVPDGGHSRYKTDTVKNVGGGISEHPYSHAFKAEIDCPHLKMIATMGKKKITKILIIKEFVKVDKCTHLMPTRGSVDIALDKTVVNKYVFRDSALNTGQEGCQGQA